MAWKVELCALCNKIYLIQVQGFGFGFFCVSAFSTVDLTLQ